MNNLYLVKCLFSVVPQGQLEEVKLLFQMIYGSVLASIHATTEIVDLLALMSDGQH